MQEIVQRQAVPTLRRDAAMIGMIGIAHMTSHLCQFALPPIFPLLRAEFGVSYSALGVVIAVFYAASGVGQAFIGILVDRHGGRPILLAGLVLLAGAVGLMAYAPAYWVLLPLAGLAGLGNSVFHPADFSILSHGVSVGRVGRAFSVHAFCGTLGYALSPALVASIAYATNWRLALSALAVFGLVVALALALSGRLIDVRGATQGSATASQGGSMPSPSFLALLLMPVMALAFAYLTLTALAGTAIQTYAAAAMSTLYAVPYAVAAGVVSAYLTGQAGGILLGGPIADRTTRHDIVAMIGLFGAAALIAIVAFGAVSFTAAIAIMTTAGASVGLTAASRDMLVKAAAPKGATGKVFGLVYSGFDVGSMIAPLALGWLVDRGLATPTLLAISLVYLATLASIVQVKQNTPAAAPG